jgi:hypothetical protein
MRRFQTRTRTATADRRKADTDSGAPQTDLETARNQPLSVIRS